LASVTDYAKTLSERTREMIDKLLEFREPPVARFRLLSRGMETYHRLYLENCEVGGDKGCLACGNCVDSCPVLRREPERLNTTVQRTSMALENTVGEDCELCYSCILACPQVDTEIKDYVVDEKIVDTIPQSAIVRRFDNYFMVVAALTFGIVIGLFLAWS
jgi:ferredoxin